MSGAFLLVQTGFQARMDVVGYAIGEALGVDDAMEGGAADALAPNAVRAQETAPGLFEPMDIVDLGRGLKSGCGTRDLVRHLAGIPDGLRRASAMAIEAKAEGDEAALRLGERLADVALGLFVDHRLAFIGPASFMGGGSRDYAGMTDAIAAAMGRYDRISGLNPFAPLVRLGFPRVVAESAFGSQAEDLEGLGALIVSVAEDWLGGRFVCDGPFDPEAETRAAYLIGALMHPDPSATEPGKLRELLKDTH